MKGIIMAESEKTRQKKSTTEKEVKEKIEQEKPVVAKTIDPEEYVIVRNGFQGKLIYRSPRTREKFIWDEFGSEQEMQLRELKNAKNTYKKYFINNWFMFDEDWIIDYLGVRQYYKNALSIEHFDEIFSMPPEKIKKVIAGLSAGQKKSVSYRATELIAADEIDSRKTIAALEEALGVDLIEK